MPAITPEILDLGRRLTPLQYRTVLNVVQHGMSNRQAYYEAGGKAKNDNAADAIVARMLGDAKVRKFMDALKAQAITEAVIDRSEVLEILSDIARSSVADLAVFRKVEVGRDQDGEPVHQTVWEFKDSDGIDRRAARIIGEVKADSDGLKLKLLSRLDAISQLRQMQGWDMPKKVELQGKNGAPLIPEAPPSGAEIAEAIKSIASKI